MPVPTQKFVRKRFEVDAVQITEENMADLANWCLGEIIEEDGVKLVRVKVARAANDRQTKGYVTDWILHAGGGFKVYTNKAFERSFDLSNHEVNMLPTTSEKLATVGTGDSSRQTPRITTGSI